jgi:cysteine desulfurase
MDRIYLDHAATSPLRPEARAAMEQGFAVWANPSSPHAEGRTARAALEDARARVKVALGWQGEVIFTSGASEALGIALGRAKAERRVVSAVEHDAVFRAAPDAEVLQMGSDGSLDGAALAAALAQPGRAIVAVQHVNSETGAIQPVAGLTGQVREAGGLLVSDCSQSAGKLDLPDCDMAVVSAHKLGGPIGIGALLVRDFALLEPTGGHERGYRAGTENLPAALGLAAALDAGGPGAGWQTLSEERRAFRGELTGEAGSEEGGDFCDYILAVTHPTMAAQALLIRLDGLGFAVSAGSACSSGSLKPSRVLKAFGLDDETARRTIRVSLGWNTRADDLARFLKAWRSLG